MDTYVQPGAGWRGIFSSPPPISTLIRYFVSPGTQLYRFPYLDVLRTHRVGASWLPDFVVSYFPFLFALSSFLPSRIEVSGLNVLFVHGPNPTLRGRAAIVIFQYAAQTHDTVAAEINIHVSGIGNLSVILFLHWSLAY